MKNKILMKSLKDLEKKLNIYFPYYHYNHVDIWAEYWNLINTIKEKN